jgi:hypothetical protein
MSFTRLNYDSEAYLASIRQSVTPADYSLQPDYAMHCTPCFSADPRAGGTYLAGGAVSTCTDRPLIDVSSELLGLPRKASRDPSQMYRPSESPYCAFAPVKDCDSIAPTEDTRLSNPPSTLRGTGWNRWEWLPQNPQDHAFPGFELHVDNRLIAKDSFRPQLPEPIDPSLVHPPESANDVVVMYDPTECNTVFNNVPSINWRSCQEIAQY